MKRLVYSYALISAVTGMKKDFIDAFIPFVLGQIDSDGLDRNSIKTKLSLCHIDIPNSVLDSIIDRSVREKYLIPDKEKFFLTEDGENIKYSKEKETDTKRILSSLYLNILHFFEERGYSNGNLTISDIEILLNDFLIKNIDSILEIISKHESFLRLERYEKFTLEETRIAQYIIHVEKYYPNNYKILNDLIKGAIINSIIQSKDGNLEVLKLLNQEFSNVRVYVDTNIVFALFDLDTDSLNSSAHELINLIKKYDIPIYIFNFTIEEIKRVINGYYWNYYRYVKYVKVGSIYSKLKSKGWEQINALEFVRELEDNLIKKGIKIDNNPTIDLQKYETLDDNLRGFFERFKKESPQITIAHDMAVIDEIVKIREGKTISKIQESKAIFVSSDVITSKIDFLAKNHFFNNSIPEIFDKRLLVNILWLKNPRMDLPLATIIAAQSEELLVNKKVWDKFYFTLAKLESEGKVSKTDISWLLFHNRIVNILLEKDGNELDTITEEIIMNELRKTPIIDDDIEQHEEPDRDFIAHLNMNGEDKDKGYSIIFTTKLVKKLRGEKWSGYSVQNAGQKKYTCLGQENGDARSVFMISNRIVFHCT